MDDAVKKRLVGAVVLVAVGVIVIPMLLDGAGHETHRGERVELPPRPEVTKRPLAKLDPLKPVPTPAESVAQQPQSEQPAPEQREQQQAQRQPSVDPLAVTPSAWVVQLGAFSSRDNAKTLRDKLRGNGHPAFVEASTDGSQFRVRIGPESDREVADRIRKDLSDELGLPGIVVRYP